MAVCPPSVRQFRIASWRWYEGGRVTEGAVATRSALSIADLLGTEEARALLEAGAASGSLNMDEIATALDELELDAGVIDDFYHALDELQIDVVRRDAIAGEEADEDEAVAAARGVSTDALQLFLKDIGRVDLLTAAQEVELAKRIERGDHRAKQAM